MMYLSTLAHSTTLATKAHMYLWAWPNKRMMIHIDYWVCTEIDVLWRSLNQASFPLTSSKWLDGEYLYTRGHCFVRKCSFTNVRTSDIELPLINHNSDWIISFDFWILLLRVSNIGRFGYLQFQVEIGSHTGDTWWTMSVTYNNLRR